MEVGFLKKLERIKKSLLTKSPKGDTIKMSREINETPSTLKKLKKSQKILDKQNKIPYNKGVR